MKKYLLVLSALLSVISFCAYAQKVPNVQVNSQWLPSTVKIDGKLLEWNDSLQAYNKATRVEYVVANDNKNLYLAVRSKDKGTTAKILAGGICFELNISGKNNAYEGPSVIYPETGKLRLYAVNLIDSIGIRNAITQLKEIKILRVKGISDSILSIYNEYGIKTKLTYANEALIYELLVPLNLVGLSSPNIRTTFSYNIKLNGKPDAARPGAPSPPPLTPPPGRAPGSLTVIANEIRSPTDFWGSYTLSGK